LAWKFPEFNQESFTNAMNNYNNAKDFAEKGFGVKMPALDKESVADSISKFDAKKFAENVKVPTIEHENLTKSLSKLDAKDVKANLMNRWKKQGKPKASAIKTKAKATLKKAADKSNLVIKKSQKKQKK
jgi:hypothetical protein